MVKDKLFELFHNKSLVVWSLILSVLRTGSVFFFRQDGEALDAQGGLAFVIVVSTLRIAFNFFIFAGILKFLDWMGEKYASLAKSELASESNVGENSEKLILRKKILWDYLFFAFLWLIPLLIKYPGAIHFDTWALFEEFRTGQITTHHSVFYMVLMGKLVSLFEAMGFANFGLFAFVGLHYLSFVFAFGYSVNVLRKLGAGTRLVWVYKILWGINPYVIGWIGVAIKDSFYSVWLFVAFLVLVEEYIRKEEALPIWKYLLFGFSLIISCLTRKNGVYVFAGILFLMVIGIIKTRYRLRMVLTIAVSICLYLAASKTLITVYNATPGSLREALSIPFQQTARFVKYHGDEVTEEEREAINECLRYEPLASHYTPNISDPVKGKYNEDASKLGPYFKVWFKQFLRHPLCYVAATWEQNYYLFVPENEMGKCSFIVNISETRNQDGEGKSQFNDNSERELFSDPGRLKTVQHEVIDFFMYLEEIPILSAMWYMTTAVYACLLNTCILLIKKRRNRIMPLVIGLLSILCTIMGPVVHFRYLFVIMYAWPIVLIYTLNTYIKDYE